MKDQELRPYYNQIDGSLKVLAIIPGTPADRLQLLVGETIAKVNGQTVRSTDEFYAAVQASGASFKLDVLDDAGEVRFVQSAIYEGDHQDRKSTRLNSSHVAISYAVFCLKKKKKKSIKI